MITRLRSYTFPDDELGYSSRIVPIVVSLPTTPGIECHSGMDPVSQGDSGQIRHRNRLSINPTETSAECRGRKRRAKEGRDLRKASVGLRLRCGDCDLSKTPVGEECPAAVGLARLSIRSVMKVSRSGLPLQSPRLVRWCGDPQVLRRLRRICPVR